jgi:hypothetical protein
MAGYRLYFVDGKGSFQARRDFTAESDSEALTIGGLLWQACSDCYPGYELWSLGRHVALPPDGLATTTLPRLEDIPQPILERVLDLQEALQRELWRPERSPRLAAATARLQRALSDRPRAIRPEEVVRYIGAATGDTMISFQLVENDRLKLRGAQGVTKQFTDYFDVVSGEDCSCGAAFRQARQVVVPDVGASPIFAGRQSLDVLRASGVAACVSTPLVHAGDGPMQGVFSILKRAVWHPADRELDQLESLARDISVALTDPLSAQARTIRGAAAPP